VRLSFIFLNAAFYIRLSESQKNRPSGLFFFLS
jgi:hypothetical protein